MFRNPRRLWLVALILGAVLPAIAQDAATGPSDIAHRHPRPDWAATLTPEQEALVAQLFLERLQAIAALERGPDRLHQAREIELRLQEKLSEFLSPEQVSGYRAGVPAILVHEPNATFAIASANCDNGYTALQQACSDAVLARDAAQADVDVHQNHNTISIQDLTAGTYLKQYACEARDIAAQARSNCQLADDAAARASQAITAAQEQQEFATASSQYCAVYYGHINYGANAAALNAQAAEEHLVQGRDFENACAACCSLTAPNATYAFAQSASNIRVEWQDRSGNETGFEIQKAVNNGGFNTIGTRNAGVEFFPDTSASADADNRYRVRAVSSTCGIQSAWSPVAFVPKSPDSLTFTRSGNNITLNWNDRSTLETNFEIWRKLGSAAWALLYTIPANQETKPNIPLQTGVNRFRVRAKTSTGFSWYTNEVSVTK